MPEPVKLSRERWEMLRAAGPPIDADCKRISIYAPLQTQGVIFLPAEYVPRIRSAADDEHQARPDSGRRDGWFGRSPPRA